MTSDAFGFVGLGNMGRPMAANLAGSGQDIVVYDAAGTQARAPRRARLAASNAALAGIVETIHLCVPDGRASQSITREIAGASGRRTRLVVDHSTIGIAAARGVHALLADHGIEYVDAPISGGVSGAVNATLAIMYSGADATLEKLRPVFERVAGNVFHVGRHPGQGQAMKLLNNFLSATAMAATAEAVAFGAAQDLDMEMILDVVNASSGRNTATSDKFPRRVLTGSYDAGFSSTQFNKDLGFYRDAARAIGTARPVSPAVCDLWRRLESRDPGADIARIYPFVRDEWGRPEQD